MSLYRATDADGQPLGLPEGPVPCEDLIALVEVPFVLPCEDPWLHGDDDAGHAYLLAAAESWREHPEWMDFLDLGSPAYDLKMAERDVYLHWWREHLGAQRVLDVGAGVGRMSMPFLDRGATVVGVDGDPEALQRFAWHAAGRPGRLDLHWSTVHALPVDEAPFDLAIACEVLCYVPEIEAALAALFDRLRPGGTLLLAMEAPWGWAAAEDAPQGALDQALAGPGIIDLAGDRWVRTYDEAGLRALLEATGFRVLEMVPTHYVPDGPLERCLDESVSLEELLEVEARCRRHPVWGPLHRIWTVTATRPG